MSLILYPLLRINGKRTYGSGTITLGNFRADIILDLCSCSINNTCVVA